MPGLIDSHIYIENSMVTSGAFAMTAVTHGTCGVVSEPHEIANVLGIAGAEFMVNSLGCAMKTSFMTLSFMTLLVIPDLKIGDRGLFDVKKFEPVSLFVE
jgi:adenine deaminase